MHIVSVVIAGLFDAQLVIKSVIVSVLSIKSVFDGMDCGCIVLSLTKGLTGLDKIFIAQPFGYTHDELNESGEE